MRLQACPSHPWWSSIREMYFVARTGLIQEGMIDQSLALVRLVTIRLVAIQSVIVLTR